MGKAIRKSTTYVLLGVTTLFGVAACGNSPSTNSSGKTSGQPVNITFWHPWTAADLPPIDAVIKEFNATHKDVHVTAIDNQTTQKQTIALAGGTPPDVILTASTNIIPWAAQGAVQSLDSFMQKSNYDVSQFIPSTMTDMKYQSHIYALPYAVQIESALLYNKKDFQVAGIKEPPKTLGELFNDTQKLTKKDGSGNISQIGFIPDYPWFDPVFWPFVFGGHFYDSSANQITPNDPANVQALEYQEKFYKLYGADQINKFKSGFGKSDTPNDPIINGQLAMKAGWNWSETESRGDNQPIGIVPFPYPDGHPELAGAGLMGPDAVFIPAKAKHQAAAWEFLQWMMSEKAQIIFAENGGSIPSVTAALSDPDLINNPSVAAEVPFYKMAASQNLGGFPASTYSSKYAQAIVDEGQKVLLGQESAKAAMDKVKSEIQPLADEAK